MIGGRVWRDNRRRWPAMTRNFTANHGMAAARVTGTTPADAGGTTVTAAPRCQPPPARGPPARPGGPTNGRRSRGLLAVAPGPMTQTVGHSVQPPRPRPASLSAAAVVPGVDSPGLRLSRTQYPSHWRRRRVRPVTTPGAAVTVTVEAAAGPGTVTGPGPGPRARRGPGPWAAAVRARLTP